ncbi:amino acid transporter [Pholiota conissans]|uniref:Amino acid transporter n=1 Tax=Pholiota conissans TaxID=109636 RepID=A0A9P6CVJ4_9AGAR|nr:amino acid transporter [Pholiota conissans]
MFFQKPLGNNSDDSDGENPQSSNASSSGPSLTNLGIAPDERAGLLGREVTLLSAVMLNIGQITGSGIYAVPGAILSSVGSIGILLVFWVVAPIFASGGLTLYAEYASLFPHRSGGEVVFLEQAYPHPRFLVSVSYAATIILTSFNASNAIVFAQYFLSAFQVTITPQKQTLVALAVSFATAATVALSTKWSLRAVNFLTSVKIIVLIFMVFTGFAVLGGFTHIDNPYANFKNPFEGSSFNGNALSTGYLKANHAFIGWANAFNVIGEVRSKNPARTVRKAGIISLVLVSILFLFINIAYIAVVPRDIIGKSGQLVAVLFFQRVFGSAGAKAFPLLVALSCFGNIQARIVREVARQGLLPYPSFFSSIKPFGTPLGPVALRTTFTALVILAIPAKDAFNFIIDLTSYPNLVFQCALAAGIWVIRARRRSLGFPPAPLRAKSIVITLYLIFCILLLVLPWYAPCLFVVLFC